MIWFQSILSSPFIPSAQLPTLCYVSMIWLDGFGFKTCVAHFSDSPSRITIRRLEIITITHLTQGHRAHNIACAAATTNINTILRGKGAHNTRHSPLSIFDLVYSTASTPSPPPPSFPRPSAGARLSPFWAFNVTCVYVVYIIETADWYCDRKN